MSLPKFVQIAAARDGSVVALGNDGTVWMWGAWRPPDHATKDGILPTPRHCWTKPTSTYDEVWPVPVLPKAKLEDCLITPPTVEEESEYEVARILGEA